MLLRLMVDFGVLNFFTEMVTLSGFQTLLVFFLVVVVVVVGDICYPLKGFQQRFFFPFSHGLRGEGADAFWT